MQATRKRIVDAVCSVEVLLTVNYTGVVTAAVSGMVFGFSETGGVALQLLLQLPRWSLREA